MFMRFHSSRWRIQFKDHWNLHSLRHHLWLIIRKSIQFYINVLILTCSLLLLVSLIVFRPNQISFYWSSMINCQKHPAAFLKKRKYSSPTGYLSFSCMYNCTNYGKEENCFSKQSIHQLLYIFLSAITFIEQLR